MGRREDVKTAIAAIYQNAGLIDDACANSLGRLQETPDTETAINRLLKNRLAYPLYTGSGYQLHGKVRGLFNHVSSKYRYRESHGLLAGLVEDLESSVESYQTGLRKGVAEAEVEHYFNECHETVIDIMDALNETVDLLHSIVHTQFAVVSDLETKKRLTRRCVNDSEKILTIFENLSVNKLGKMVGLNLQLERLLLFALKGFVDRKVKDLSGAAKKLSLLLSTLVTAERDQKLNRLIDAFDQKFKMEPDYRPEAEDIYRLPEAIKTPEPLIIEAYPDVHSELAEEALTDLAVKVLQKNPPGRNKDAQDSGRLEVDTSDLGTLEEVIDPMEQALEMLFAPLIDNTRQKDISVMEAYGLLSVEAEPEDWLMMASSYCSSKKDGLSRYWRVEYDLVEGGVFTGNQLVRDIHFRRLDNA